MERLQWKWTRLVTALAALAVLATAPARADDEKVAALALKEGTAKDANKLSDTDGKDKVRKQLCKLYTVNLKGGNTYQIDMTSKEIDPFLRLEDAGGKELASDDDSGGFPNARIVFPCPKDGSYRVIATTFAGGTGAFELSVTHLAAAKATELILKGGEAKIEAAIGPTDPKDNVRKSSACKTYTAKLAKGKTYQIDMMSKQIDSYLRLEDSNGKQLAQDDDSGDSLDARIIFTAPDDGVYRIIATTFVGGTGPFTLLVKEK
jgi:serine protease Do